MRPFMMSVVLVFASVGLAQPTSSVKVESATVEVRFADDSTVKMELQHATIDLVTRYGKLTFPLSDIRRIEFGARISPEVESRIAAAIARLGDADARQRDAAGAELLALKEASYPALQQAVKSKDAEVARRARDLLKTLNDTVPAERLRQPRTDTVVTSEFTITGQVEPAIFKARTAYFGETQVKAHDVRSMRWLGSARDAKLLVDGAKFGGAQDVWMDTGIDVRAGSVLSVTATGTVELRSSSGDVAGPVGPDGSRSRTDRGGGPGGGGPGAGGPGAGGFGNRAGRPFVTSSPGALVGRIGESGRTFVIGSRYEAPAAEDGKLYVRIVPPSGGGETVGAYEVRIGAGR